MIETITSDGFVVMCAFLGVIFAASAFISTWESFGNEDKKWIMDKVARRFKIFISISVASLILMIIGGFIL